MSSSNNHWTESMLEQPVYLRMPTINEAPLLKNRSCAEVVINVVISAQRQNWLRLHGFAVMPEALEMVFTPIQQGVKGVAAHIQAETIPPLTILLPDAGLIWARQSTHIDLENQRSLEARLNMMLLVPVANGIVDKAESYAYSSANPRYSGTVMEYTGYKKPESSLQTGMNGLSEALNAGRKDTLFEPPAPSAPPAPSTSTEPTVSPAPSTPTESTVSPAATPIEPISETADTSPEPNPIKPG